MRDSRLSPDRLDALAELNASRPVKVIAVTGGKGGVGKTTVSANLAVSIAAQASVNPFSNRCQSALPGSIRNA